MHSAMLRGLVVVVIALTLAGAAGEAWARAGSGGSRGSRSYAPPSRPAPMSPASPASPSRSVNTPASSPRPGMFGGGLMGALGGFMLGGLLGSMLFGGMGGLGSGLGIGLMDLLLIGGGLFLLFRFMKSRQQQPQPAYAGAYAGGGGPRVAEVPSGGGTVVEERPSALDDLDRGLGHIRAMDGGFDAAALASDAAETFRAVQTALTAGDMSPLRPRLTSEMLERMQMQCNELRRTGHTNHVERIQIERAEVTEAWQERGRDYVSVILAGSLVDYTVDARGGLVSGSRNPERFEEFWTFTRLVGPNAWTLTAIQAG
jgi:predicted lipid-binding transport protein (Tim44 family)